VREVKDGRREETMTTIRAVLKNVWAREIEVAARENPESEHQQRFMEALADHAVTAFRLSSAQSAVRTPPTTPTICTAAEALWIRLP
jgi:hypothetical protein